MNSPTPDHPRPEATGSAGSARWRTLVEQLEIRDRWSAHCRRMVAAAAAAAAAPAPKTESASLLREFLAGHTAHVPGGRPVSAVGPGEEDFLTPDGVRAFLAWVVQEKGADPALARAIADKLPAPRLPL